MANNSYFNRLARGVVLTSILTDSAMGIGCALHKTSVQQSYVDIKTWRAGPEHALVEYDGNVFFLMIMPSLQNENLMAFLNRAVKLMNESEDTNPVLRERISDADLIRKGADLFSIINADKEGFYSSSLSGSRDTKQIKLRRVLNHGVLTPDVYYVTVPSPWSTIQQAKDFYERQ